jgi:Tol biopolymer transport system component/tRNA A-37 threonylcarbamoyl transferase component Bud32
MTTPTEKLASALADRYRIERELGAGGMATVYLAEDLRHDRRVALKVLRPELAAIIGADRFLQEIKTTANLQHPHILALFDSGQAGEVVFYVMPYVEGESLRDRLAREKQLPVDEAVRIAREVADALAYAHEHGVVHRDIKPENILLHGGHALVADFGIALAAARSDGGSRMTETGMSLGTPHYMAPEQAMGEREITPKADIYALGCVLYEMLTAEPPFTGATAQAIVARVMTEQPRPLTVQRRTIPPHVEAAVQQALEKLPADRFATAKEFSEALGGKATGRYTASTPAAAAPATLPPYRHPAFLALTAVTLIAGAAAGYFAQRDPGPPPARFAITLPTEVPPVAVRLSPDGQTIAYAAAGDGDRLAIFTRRIDDLTPVKVEGSDDATTVSFSPDGQWLAFVTIGGQARKVARSGGGSVAIQIRNAGTLNQIDFLGDDRFVATLGDRSLAVVEGDGSATVFARADSTPSGRVLVADEVLSDGWVLARQWTAPPNGPVIAIEPSSGKRVVLVDQLASWAGAGDGFLAWSVPDGTIFAAPFDLGSKKLTAPGRPVSGQLFSIAGFTPPAAAGGHALVYVPGRNRILTRVNRLGIGTPLLTTDRTYHSPRVSPDGRRVAVDFTDQQRDVWLFSLGDSTLTRFGFDSSGHDPTWLPDGSGLLFAAIRGSDVGIFRRRFDGRSAAESVLVAGPQISAHAVTPDGREAVAVDISRGQFDLFRVPLKEPGPIDTLAGTTYNEGYPSLSPDGRWLAYVSDESGRAEVYVRTYPAFTSKVQVSQDGGSEPVWSRNGREIFYRSGGGAEPKLLAARVATDGGFRVTGREPLFGVGSYEFASPHANYDVFPDGQSFVMVRQGRTGQSAEIVYLQNLLGLLQGRGR